MREVFRVTKKYLATEDGFGAVFLSAAGIFFLYIGSKVFGAISLVIGLFHVKDVIQLSKGRIEIDETKLRIVQGNEVSDIEWKEVIVARLEENHAKPRKVLVMAIEDDQQLTAFNIEQYDHQRIWELTQKYVRPNALAPDAAHRLEGYQEWKAQQSELVNQIPLPFEIKDSWLMRGSGWILFGMFGFFAWIFWDAKDAAGKYFGTGLCLVFVAMGFYVILTTGKTLITQARIERHLPLATYALSWQEIRYMEADVYSSFIFWGEDKYLFVPPLSYVAQKSRESYGLLLETYLEKHRIETRLTRKIRRFAKNTRVG